MNELIVAKTTFVGVVVLAVGSMIFALTDTVSISIVTGVVAVLTSAISAYFGYRAKIAAEESKATSLTTEKALNGHLNEYKELAKTAYTAEGVLREKEAENIRKTDAAASIAQGVEQERAEKALRKSDPPL